MADPFHKIRAIDIETTGMEPPAYPIEFAQADLCYEDSREWILGDASSFLMNPKPGEKIPSSAKAVHHITDDMLKEPSVKTRDEAVKLIEHALQNAGVIAAHQARFEKQWLQYLAGEVPWICTWKVACTRYPNMESHSLQFLRYEFDLDSRWVEPGEANPLNPAHRALPDALACVMLVERFLSDGITVEEMIDISWRPCLLPKVTFGKHINEKWHDVPTSYLDWTIKNITDDEDIQHTAKYWFRIKNSNKKAS